MAYIQWDKSGNVITQHDLQDKGSWCIHGYTKEQAFIHRYGARLNLQINPDKRTNPYAPDLSYTNMPRLAELKTQNTPFFRATRFGLDPQYTVTFNVEVKDTYQAVYPDMDVYFWVDWVVTAYRDRYGTVTVAPMEGVWGITCADLMQMCVPSRRHWYAQRLQDWKGNNRASYLIDLRDPRCHRVA